jgi:hypothetical protein
MSRNDGNATVCAQWVRHSADRNTLDNGLLTLKAPASAIVGRYVERRSLFFEGAMRRATLACARRANGQT